MSAPMPPHRSDTAIRDHLANERTYLAWVRTAVTFVGLGFAVNQLLFDDPLGSALGIGMMVVGGLMMVPALASYQRTERAIATGGNVPPLHASIPLAVVVMGGALALVAFSLLRSW
jgi:inner membrane protein YidH